MIRILSIIYGAHIAGVVYLIAYFTARAVFGSKAIPVYIVIGKYLIFWQLIAFAVKFLLIGSVLIGFTFGIYLGLPVLYLINKKMNTGGSETS